MTPKYLKKKFMISGNLHCKQASATIAQIIFFNLNPIIIGIGSVEKKETVFFDKSGLIKYSK
jgi:hypothetical protein